MIVIEKFQRAQARKWLKDNIYCIAAYRRLLQEQNEMKDLSETEKKRLAEKIRHLDKKIDNFIASGEGLSLPKTQIIEINRQIVGELIKGKSPKVIFHQFLNGKVRAGI